MNQAQIDQIFVSYTNEMTQKQKDSFLKTRKRVEQNIDLYREDLTYMELDFMNIKKMLDIVWECWRNYRPGSDA